MSEEVSMPAVGESVTEGTVTQWLKQVGDTVEVDEPLLEVSTDKVDTEIPSPVAGTVQEIRVQEDETVEVGTVLAVVGSGEAAPAASEEPAQQAPAQEAPAPAPAEEAPAQEPAPAAEAAPAAQESSSQQAQPAAASGSAAPAGGAGGEEVEMPALGESVTEGTVTQWLKQVGDTVEVDEPLLEVSTDKVDTEIPSPVAGTVQEIRVQEDETVEVGTVLAVVGSGEAAPAASEEPAQQAPAQEAPAPAPAEEAPAQEPAPAADAAPAAQESSSQQVQPAAASGSAAPAGGAGGEEVEMPALGESVTEGTVTQWLKQVGDTVEVDEPLLEVSTDKVDTEIPTPVARTVQEIR